MIKIQKKTVASMADDERRKTLTNECAGSAISRPTHNKKNTKKT
jgi:hypothetical protein